MNDNPVDHLTSWLGLEQADHIDRLLDALAENGDVTALAHANLADLLSGANPHTVPSNNSGPSIEGSAVCAGVSAVTAPFVATAIKGLTDAYRRWKQHRSSGR